MKKYFIIAAFLVIFMGSYCVAKDQPGEQNIVLSGKIENGVRVIKVKAFRYKFSPDPIVVELNDKVRLLVSSDDVAHGLAIPEFKVNVVVMPDKTEIAEFTADQKGTFTAVCSVYCGTSHNQMRAKFIVK